LFPLQQPVGSLAEDFEFAGIDFENVGDGLAGFGGVGKQSVERRYFLTQRAITIRVRRDETLG